MIQIKLHRGDITKLKVDAIVNAANETLLGGGGVDGAIHRAAGPELLKECQGLMGCSTGNAKITKAYNLPAKYVIHTVGPIWRGGKNNEVELLASCYKHCLTLACEYELHSVAFPNISTGVYHFPKAAAADIAIHTVQKFLKFNNSIETIVFVAFDEENYSLYENRL